MSVWSVLCLKHFFLLILDLRNVTKECLCVVSQKVEAQEREEQSSGKAIKLVKGKVGKPKVKKMNLEETMPSPFGRRVEPPTQPIKSDAAKKLTKKKKVTAADVVLKGERKRVISGSRFVTSLVFLSG